MEIDLPAVFARLRKLLKKYENPPMSPNFDLEGRYELWSRKAVEVEGRKKKEIYFAGLIVQKGYVGFYFMPVYAAPDIKRVFAPELLALRKGKSCFHIRALDAALEQRVAAALAAGFKLYRDRGWV